MKLSTYLVLLALLTGIGACRTNPSTANPGESEIPCTCGTPDALFEGCAHPLCASGHNNPKNPDCVCGSIRIAPMNGK